MKKMIQKTLNRFGYQLGKKENMDAYAMQRKLIQAGEPIIFDIGAHQGSVAKTYRKHFPLASIHCFEPFPESFQILSESLEKDSRSYCYQSAMSDKKGTAILNANLSSATNSLLDTDERGASFWGGGLLETMSQIEVDTSTVDQFCFDENIPHIDILKMDVQGNEFSILEGAESILKDQRVSLIYTELIICPTYKGQHKFHEYLSYLASFDYDFMDFYNPCRSHDQLIQTDVIFLSSRFKKSKVNKSS